MSLNEKPLKFTTSFCYFMTQMLLNRQIMSFEAMIQGFFTLGMVAVPESKCDCLWCPLEHCFVLFYYLFWCCNSLQHLLASHGIIPDKGGFLLLLIMSSSS